MNDSSGQSRHELDLAAPAQAFEEMVSSGDRRVDMAWVLAGIGAFFFLPATVAVFSAPMKIFGLPVLWVYLFGVWLMLIFAAAFISFVRPSLKRRREGSEAPDRSAQ